MRRSKAQIMETEINRVEVRQGDRRKMNMRALLWGLPAAFVLLGVLAAAWAWH
jgi:hypothetical protein